MRQRINVHPEIGRCPSWSVRESQVRCSLVAFLLLHPRVADRVQSSLPDSLILYLTEVYASYMAITMALIINRRTVLCIDKCIVLSVVLKQKADLQFCPVLLIFCQLLSNMNTQFCALLQPIYSIQHCFLHDQSDKWQCLVVEH